jgi:hypothetical protein
MKELILRERREEQRKMEAYMKHPCKRCVFSKWQGKSVVSCLFASCVKDKFRSDKR